MEVLAVIAIIVFGYIMYKNYEQDKQDELRKQEAVARLNFEQELKKKATQWSNSPFFLKLANYTTSKILDEVKTASTHKVSRSYKDIRTIICRDRCIKINSSYYTYSELGFDFLQNDSTNTTIASLNLALLQYIQKKFQSMPEISFSLRGGTLEKCIFVDSRDGHLSWNENSFKIECDLTKVHPLLEEIKLP